MQHLLNGSNSEGKIVAVHPATDQTMRVYTRTPGGLASEEIKFYPFFHLSDPTYLSKYDKHYWLKELSGGNKLRYIAAFTGWSDMWEGVRCCLNEYNETAQAKAQTFQEIPNLYLRPDPLTQFLKQSGRTLFKSMKFSDLHRMQIEILTLVRQGFNVSNFERPEDKIIVISLSDNRDWKIILDAKKRTEEDILNEAIKLILERNPDILEGLNLSTFILPYIIGRCKIYGIEPSIGRDGSVPTLLESRVIYSERFTTTGAVAIAGRHVVDIQLLHESTESAKQPSDQTILNKLMHISRRETWEKINIPPQRRNLTWENEPDTLIELTAQAVEEIEYISKILLPPFFRLTQIIPFNLGSVIRLSGTAKIDALLLREYILQKHALPMIETQSTAHPEDGEIYARGVFSNIVVLDIKALTASLIHAENIKIETDTLETYGKLVGEILNGYNRSFKSFSETTTKKTKEPATEQKAQLILMHSVAEHFFSNRAIFHDAAAAEKLTEKLHETLKEVISLIISSGGAVIQTDMEGLYFVPPERINTQDQADNYIGTISHSMGNRIILRILDRNKGMLSYKKKNYALLSQTDRISIHGPTLIPRNIELFGKKFMSKAIESLLRKDIDHLHNIYLDFFKNISDHRLVVADFQKTETLTESKDKYINETEDGKRSRGAVYEAALNSKMEWIAGDKISYYVRGDEPNPRNFDVYRLADEWDKEYPDENTAYYLRRLNDFTRKFEPFFSAQDFHAIFSADDLFGFSAADKSIINTQMPAGEVARIEEDTEVFEVNPKIWLDI